MIYDDYLTPEEMRLIETLKGKTRTEKDQIIFEHERGKTNGNTIRTNNTSTGTIRTATK